MEWTKKEIDKANFLNLTKKEKKEIEKLILSLPVPEKYKLYLSVMDNEYNLSNEYNPKEQNSRNRFLQRKCFNHIIDYFNENLGELDTMFWDADAQQTLMKMLNKPLLEN